MAVDQSGIRLAQLYHDDETEPPIYVPTTLEYKCNCKTKIHLFAYLILLGIIVSLSLVITIRSVSEKPPENIQTLSLVCQNLSLPDRMENHTCAFFYPMKGQFGIHDLLYQEKKSISLHGFWPNVVSDSLPRYIKSNFQICKPFKQFSRDFKNLDQNKYLISGLPSDDNPEHCCQFQYHEYHKHACLLGHPFDFWLEGLKQCWATKDRTLYPTKAIFSEEYQANCILQTSTNPDEGCYGCKPGFPFKVCLD